MTASPSAAPELGKPGPFWTFLVRTGDQTGEKNRGKKLLLGITICICGSVRCLALRMFSDNPWPFSVWSGVKAAPQGANVWSI